MPSASLYSKSFERIDLSENLKRININIQAKPCQIVDETVLHHMFQRQPHMITFKIVLIMRFKVTAS